MGGGGGGGGVVVVGEGGEDKGRPKFPEGEHSRAQLDKHASDASTHPYKILPRLYNIR